MGQVCLQNAIAFGVVATLMTWVIYPALEQLLSKVVERGGAHAVQLREADTHTLIEFDLERF